MLSLLFPLIVLAAATPGCLPGQYVFDGFAEDSVPTCQPCEVGRFSPDSNGLNYCHQCAPGQYNNEIGQVACKACEQPTDEPACAEVTGYWPLLFIVGAQKAGSTSIWEAIHDSNTSQYCSPLGVTDYEQKERHFFDAELPKYEHDHHHENAAAVQSYIRTYPRNDCKYIDGTPDYFQYKISKRMKRIYPNNQAKDVLFIVMFREPVSRFLSALNHEISEGFMWYGCNIPAEEVTLASYLDDERCSTNMLQRGEYAPILAEFLKDWSFRQFLILDYDDLVQDAQGVLRKVKEFTHISADLVSLPIRNKIPNVFKFKTKEDCHALHRLRNHYKPYNKYLESLMSLKKHPWKMYKFSHKKILAKYDPDGICDTKMRRLSRRT